MNARQLSYLGGVAVLVIAGAVWLSVMRKPDATQSAALYPKLNNELNKVNELKIYHAGDAPVVEVKQASTGWTVTQRHDYPANVGKVNSLLIALAEAKLREEKTGNPENYATLGVADDATRLEVGGVDPAIKLLVGKSDAAAHASYVRRAGEKQSWLIDQQLDVATDPAAWLRRELLNIGADRIQECVTQLSGAPSYRVFKNARADANFDVTPVPKGREINSVSTANAISQALVNLQLDDVMPTSELSDKPSAHATFHTFDGWVIDLDGFNVNGKHWLTAKAAYDAALAKRFYVPTKKVEAATPTPTPTSTPPKPVEASATPTAPTEEEEAKNRTEVEHLNASLTGWAFAVPQYKYEAIFRPLDDLLKKTDSLLKKK